MAPTLPSGRRQPGRSGRKTLHLPALPARAMEVDSYDQRRRAPSRRVQAAHQDTVMLPCAETACMLFWALLASGQITLRRVDGWDTFHIPAAEPNLDYAA